MSDLRRIDQEELLALSRAGARHRTPPGGLGERSLEALEHLLSSLNDCPAWACADSWICLDPHAREAATGYRLGRVLDLWAPDPQVRRRLWQAVVSEARERALALLQLELGPEESAADLGLLAAQWRIALTPRPHDLNTVRQSRFRIRSAREGDRMFISGLLARNLPHLIPSHREAEAQTLIRAHLGAWARSPIEGHPTRQTLLAEERESGRKVGFLTLERSHVSVLCRQICVYLEDISVHPDFWGTYATQRLVRQAERLLVGQADYLIGDVATSNPRAFHTARRSLGFRLFAVRWEAHVAGM